MVAYVFYLILTPGPNSLYYFSDGLHFSKQFIGDLQKWHAAGTVLDAPAESRSTRTARSEP